MNRILSWKIEAGVYAYIYLPNSNTHISNRIDETSPIWASVIGEISGWDEDTYKTHFEEMANEISQRYGVTLSYKSEYYNFTDDSSVGSTNIVILAGEDGNGGSFDGGSGGEGSAGEVYEEFLKAVDDKLNAARADIEAENAAIQEYLETKITQSISEAQKTIEETKEELDKQKEEMLGRLDDASDALEKAADLFDMGDGNITADTIKEVFSSVQEYSGWMDDYSGAVIDMKTDYDSANKTMGSIGTGEDVTKGAFSKMAISLNVLSGTVGTVRTEMDASTASIREMATWYSENAGVVGEASRYLSASAGVISDTVNYVNNDLNSHIEQEINASEGRVKTELMAEIDDNINNVTQTISSFSASMETALTHYGDELITVGSKMEAMSGTMEEYITKTDSAMAIADDLRESWSIESGKISSVSHAIAETDEEGNIIYYASGETFGEVVVTKNAEGKWVDSTGKIYEQSQVYVHYGEMMSSYIRQTASSTTISVMNTDNVTAAIKLAIKEDAEGDKAVINMVADEVVIDADMIVRAISAKTANIGGVIIDYGSVYSMASAERQSDTLYFALLYTSSAISQGEINGVGEDGYPTYEAIITYTYTMVLLDSKPADFDSSETVEEKILKKELDKYITTKSASLKYLKGNYYVPMFKLDGIDGTLYAANADIRGKITATSGEIGGSIISDNSIKSKKNNSSGRAMFELNGENGTLYAENADIKGKITATSGEIGGFTLSDNMFQSFDSESDSLTSIINGGPKFSSDENGKLLLAAGITNDGEQSVTLYRWTCMSDPDYTTIYTLYNYKEEDVDFEVTSDMSVTAYSYNTISKKANRIYGDFVFKKDVVDADAGDDVITSIETYEDSEGQVIKKYYSEYILRSFDDGEERGESKYKADGVTIRTTGILLANTTIYADGSVNTNSLNASDGWYGGTINSDGIFKGTLQYATGTLSNVTIDANKIYGNFILNNDGSLKGNSGSTEYINVSSIKLSSNGTMEKYSFALQEPYMKNKNGSTKYLEGSWDLATIPFESGADITFIDFLVNVKYWLCNKRTAKGGWCQITCTAKYNDGSSSALGDFQRWSLPSATGKGDRYLTVGFKGPKTLPTMTKPGRLQIRFIYFVPVPDKNGVSYCTARLSIDTNGVTINYAQPKTGTSIGVNGFKSITPDKATLLAVDKTIMAISPNTKYGLRVTDTGVEIMKDGTWSSL